MTRIFNELLNFTHFVPELLNIYNWRLKLQSWVTSLFLTFILIYHIKLPITFFFHSLFKSLINIQDEALYCEQFDNFINNDFNGNWFTRLLHNSTGSVCSIIWLFIITVIFKITRTIHVYSIEIKRLFITRHAGNAKTNSIMLNASFSDMLNI